MVSGKLGQLYQEGQLNEGFDAGIGWEMVFELTSGFVMCDT
jgi:hypothetical protein